MAGGLTVAAALLPAQALAEKSSTRAGGSTAKKTGLNPSKKVVGVAKPKGRLKGGGVPVGGVSAPPASVQVVNLSAAPAPAQAVDRYYSYQISGNFANNTGPNQKGSFVGVAQWDPAINGGRGGWYAWNFDFLSPGGTLLHTIKQSDPGAGCFASPLARGLAAVGTYAESAPGGAVCDGSNTQSGGNLPPQSFLNIFSNVPYAWSQGGNKLNASYTYFRLQFQANGPGGTSVDPANLVLVPANAQSVGGLGWAAMRDDTKDGACTGNKSFPTALQPHNDCPYAGNTQNHQGVSGLTEVMVTTSPGDDDTPSSREPVNLTLLQDKPEVPGPLPILGASAALGWSRRLRRRIRRGIAA